MVTYYSELPVLGEARGKGGRSRWRGCSRVPWVWRRCAGGLVCSVRQDRRGPCQPQPFFQGCWRTQEAGTWQVSLGWVLYCESKSWGQVPEVGNLVLRIPAGEPRAAGSCVQRNRADSHQGPRELRGTECPVPLLRCGKMGSCVGRPVALTLKCLLGSHPSPPICLLPLKILMVPKSAKSADSPGLGPLGALPLKTGGMG